MHDALLAPPLAGRLRMKGVNLQPEFAQGKPVMAEGVGTREISRAPKNWHAIVRESDDAEVCEDLEDLVGNLVDLLRDAEMSEHLRSIHPILRVPRGGLVVHPSPM